MTLGSAAYAMLPQCWHKPIATNVESDQSDCTALQRATASTVCRSPWLLRMPSDTRAVRENPQSPPSRSHALTLSRSHALTLSRQRFHQSIDRVSVVHLGDAEQERVGKFRVPTGQRNT